jgi:hypothetical protein
MIRQAKRKELRDLAKEHRKITNSNVFKGLYRTNILEGLTEDDKTLLKEKKHPDMKLQARFNLNVLMLIRLQQIEQKMKQLNNKEV